MPPKLNASQDDLELFRSRLENIIDQRHPLVRLAQLIDWRVFEERFGALYAEAAGRPALPTRLMVALHLHKHMDGLSDEAICARYLDSPYAQAFCGETHFQHALPLDRSSMTRWRKQIGPERMEALLAETPAAAERGGAVAEKHYERVTIDTTVQPKAVTHPTDSKLLHSGIKTLARMARRHGITLRQSYRHVARYARQEAARLHHGGKRHEAEARVRKLRTRLDRLARDITRKIAGNAEAKATFAETLGLINRLLRQKRSDRGADKLYSLHAPEVECIGKGKGRTRFEFGVKVSIATTNAAAPGGQFVLGMQTRPGNPYDGHTLAGQIEQVERITGVAVARAYVDRGYRGHGVEAEGRRIFTSRQKRGITPTIRRELRRRAAIEPVIGHMKTDGLLGRNFLLGVDGDAINAVLARVGHNLRVLRRWLIRLLCALVAWLSAPTPSPSLGFAHRQIT